ncbi:MAG: glycosyltransferase family 2 protein [Myxococcota bacterium]
MNRALSACVIARDDEHHIRRCLASLAWADECVVVVDDRSRDSTEAVARELGAQVVRHRYEGNVEQKNAALGLVKGDWVVSLDADEALSEALAAHVRQAIDAAGPDVAGFELCRVTFHLGRWIRHGDFHPDWQLRVFRRAAGCWAGTNPHGRVRVRGRVRRISGDLVHDSYRDLSDQLERIRDFSGVEAAEMHRAGRRARRRDLVLRPIARWLRAVVLKRGYRDGVPGLILAGMTACHVFFKYARLWELERGEPRTDA